MALIDISRLSFTYEGSYDPVFQDLSLQLDTNWRLGLIGRNGRGKTTLLRLLMGQEIYRGTISSPVAFDYFPFSVPDGARTGEEVAEALHPGLERWRLLRELHLLDLDEGVLYHPFGTLSNGEQTRFLLALLFLGDHRFLLIDEPTNHLDIASREWVEAAIEEFEGVLLFVSHDRYFIEKFAERIWLLEDGKIRDFPCGYQKYRSILEHEAAAKPAVSAAPKPKKERAKGGTKDADKLVRRLEREIEKQEQVVADFDRKIEAASADYQELTRLLGEKEEAEAALMDLMEQWEQVQT